MLELPGIIWSLASAIREIKESIKAGLLRLVNKE